MGIQVMCNDYLLNMHRRAQIKSHSISGDKQKKKKKVMRRREFALADQSYVGLGISRNVALTTTDRSQLHNPSTHATLVSDNRQLNASLGEILQIQLLVLAEMKVCTVVESSPDVCH